MVKKMVGVFSLLYTCISIIFGIIYFTSKKVRFITAKTFACKTIDDIMEDINVNKAVEKRRIGF